MHLKKLELIGFKSFADKTEVHFDKGVTCVVGPNGCGKSNISDAIRWVLGERSAKMLRGAKMEDVIFNGTDFRKPTAMAEVSLTIDNHDRGLPIDYKEVTISRRLYRSGESEYMINRTVCRLKDVQDLILDTGIGSSSYSMIEQGRIDYILSADPEERRFLIEEAAGISKYKVKKEEAIRKLERTEENRLRLSDIIAEVQRNIQYAERQARRAERYKEQFEALKKLEIQKAFYDIGLLRGEKGELEAKSHEHTGFSEKINAQVAECQARQDELSETLKGILDRFAAEDGKRHSLQSRIDQIQQQLAFHQEKRVELASRRGEIQQEIRQLEERMATSARESSGKQKEIETLQADREKASQALAVSESAMAGLEAALKEIKSETEGLRSLAFEAASKTTQARNEFHKLMALLESNEQQARKNEAEAGRLSEEKYALEGKRQGYADELKNSSDKLLGLQRHIADKIGAVRQEEKLIHDFQQAVFELDRQRQEKQTRLDILLEKSRAAKARDEELIGEDLDPGRSLIQSVEGLIKAQSGYEWAVEAALEAFAKSLVVETLESAEALLKRIQDVQPSPLGVLVREKSYGAPLPSADQNTAPRHAAIERPLAEVVYVRDEYRHLLEPFIQNVYILRDGAGEAWMADLLGLARQSKFVSRDGLIIGPQGRIFYKNTHHIEDSPFQRDAEIRKLEHETGYLSAASQQKLGSLEASRRNLEQYKQELQDLEGRKLDTAIQKESFQSLDGGTEERLAAVKREIQLLSFEREEMAGQYRDAVSRKDRIEAELKDAENLEQQLHEKAEDLLRRREATEHEKSALMKSLAEHRARFEHVDERHRLLEESLALILSHQKTDAERVEALKQEHGRSAQKEKELVAKDEQLSAERLRDEDARRRSEVALEMIRQEKEAAESRLEVSQKELQELQQRREADQKELHQIEIKIMDLAYKEKNIYERLAQTYHLKLQDYQPEAYPLELVPEEAAARIEELQGKVEKIGTVNLLAIEEYEELKQRFDFLMTQQKDLDEARTQLLETIRKINRTTKSLFEETFQSVQKNFQEYYEILFRGGYARLVLVDETNPLESGIDIVVRPPGKKPQHISLLSGGEKALTAIALLFSLFKIKPSPFSVLDEVDAPLDEANIDRFLQVLKTFLHVSQFIIVTHNRKTIAMGDSLYGVTMQEAGVSKLVSVRVGQEESEDAPDANDEIVSATEEDEQEQVQA